MQSYEDSDAKVITAIRFGLGGKPREAPEAIKATGVASKKETRSWFRLARFSIDHLHVHVCVRTGWRKRNALPFRGSGVFPDMVIHKLINLSH